jgi:hypothetical protein
LIQLHKTRIIPKEMSLLGSDLSIAPLGAGDLIDRAVRLYRRHFLTLIGIAAPPVLVSALGSTITTIAWRELNATSSDVNMALYVLMLLAGLVIIACGALFSVIVMGGATRNLVAHLLWDEPVTARATYRAVKSRFWGLLWASVLVALWLTFAALLGFMAFMMVFGVMAAAIGVASIVIGWLTVIFWTIGSIAAFLAGAILFFFLAGRMAYVPQAMLVEGKTVFAAIGRSFSLASGNVRRLMAMTLFTAFTTYSALMLLMIPLGWYGHLNGVSVSPFGSTWPTWYSIGYQVILQCSHMLLAPIWMLGFSLLYVDERVRHEGYDIELMAARHLPEMPVLPGVVSPFAPALVTGRAPKFVPPPLNPAPPRSVLGLS